MLTANRQASTRASLTSNPMPDPPARRSSARLTITGGSMMSSCQYRADAAISPGSVKPDSVERAMLCAADAGFQHSAAPHRHAVRLREAWISFASLYPPTRPSLILMIRRAQLVCVLRVCQAQDGFIETDRVWTPRCNLA